MMRYGDRDRSRNRGPDRERGRERGRDGNMHDNRNRGGQEFRDHARRSHRRRRRDFSRRPREQVHRDWPPCPICERAIQEPTSAMTHTESGQPAHFDCVMKKIGEAEGLGANERICYLGKGSFGILRFQKNGGNIPFVIRKRIQYENLDAPPEWRKKLDKFYIAREKEKQAAGEKADAPPVVREEREATADQGTAAAENPGGSNAAL